MKLLKLLLCVTSLSIAVVTFAKPSDSTPTDLKVAYEPFKASAPFAHKFKSQDSVTPSVPEFKYSLAFDRSGTTAVISKTIGKLNGVFGTDLSPEVWALGSYSTQDTTFGYGVAAVFSYKATKDGGLTLFAGPTFRGSFSASPASMSLGILVGLSFKG